MRFESVQVVHYLAAEEGAAVFQCRLVDDYFRTFGFHPLHYALDAGLAEVIAVRFHRQAVNADSALALLVGAEITAVVIVVISGFGQHTVGNEVFPCAVAFHNRLNQVLGHIGIVCQELFRIFG